MIRYLLKQFVDKIYLQVETGLNIIPSFYGKDHSLNLEFEKNHGRMTQQFDCKASLGEIFLGFINYIAGLDTEKFCLTLEAKLDRMDEKMYFTRELRDTFQPFIVQDPLDRRNATYSVLTKKALKVIKDKFKRTAEVASSQTKLERLCEPQQQENPELKELERHFDDLLV